MNLKIYKTDKISGTIIAPPSKSYTHRAIIMASIANGKSLIKYPLLSEDTIASINACKILGANIEVKNKNNLIIEGIFPFQPKGNLIDVKNSGTTIRIMSALCGFYPGKIKLTGDASIQKRPMGPLINALQQLGTKIYSEKNNGCPPIIIEGPTLKGGITSIRGDVSSQFITALLISTPLAEKSTELKIISELKSKPYILITLDSLKKFNIKISHNQNMTEFFIKGKQKYMPYNYVIPGDFSSAAFMLALAAITKSKLTIKNLDINSPQGDKRIIHILEQMGCNIKIDSENKSIIISNTNDLKPIELNMGDIPDLFPIICILAVFAHGKTKIYGAQHLRYKESDRIHAMYTELKKLGVNVKEFNDGIEIIGPNNLRNIKLNTYNDHRIAMAFSILGTMMDELIIPDIEICKVSYPNFIEHLKILGVQYEVFE